MKEISFRATDQLINMIDIEVRQKGFPDRSEYIRYALRQAIDRNLVPRRYP